MPRAGEGIRMAGPVTIEQYLAAVPLPRRATLETLRQTVNARG